MSLLSSIRWITVASSIVLGAMLVQAQATPSLEEILKQAADGAAFFAAHVSGVAGEEQYIQRNTTGGQQLGTHSMKSEVVLLGATNDTVRAFRDVFEVEGTPIRKRDDRLLALFAKPAPDAFAQAEAFDSESMRRFAVQMQNTPATPWLAFKIVPAEAQARFTFKLDGIKTMNGKQVAILRFAEQGTSQLFMLPHGDKGATGRLWIEMDTGALRQSEVLIDSSGVSLRVLVNFAFDPKIALWLPSSLDEHDEISVTNADTGSASVMGSGTGYLANATFDNHASYVKFHQTPVDANVIIK